MSKIVSKIIGNTVGMGLPKPNLMQDDPTKGDYVKGKASFLEQAAPDLTGYAKTDDIPKNPEDIGAQPAGEYLTEVPEGYATEEYVRNKIAEAELAGGDVDLSGYAQKSEIPTKTSQLTNDSGFMTKVPDGYAKTADIPTKPEDIGAQPAGSYLTDETDPTVPSWAKQPKKPTYTASEVGARPDNWVPTAQEVGALPNTYIPPNQTAAQVGADPAGTAERKVSEHNADAASHNDLRLEVKAIREQLTAFLDVDEETLNELSELIAAIAANQTSIEQLTSGKVNVSDIVNNLVSNVTNKPLSAAQGVELKRLIDNVSASLTNYQPKGDYLTEHQSLAHLLPRTELTTAINTALAQAKADGEFDGADGQRGPGLLSVTTAPSSYTTAVGGITPKYRMAISTIKSQADVTEVLLGDTIRYSYYQYPIDYLDANYAYCTTRISVRGATGTAATFEITGTTALAYGAAPTVTEQADSTEQARKYMLGIPTGKPGEPGAPGGDGYTPQRGKDYWTPDDIAAMDAKLAQMLAERAQLRPEPAESLAWLAENGDTSKLYVLMDKTSEHYGYIYGWYMTEVESGPAYTNVLPLAINSDKTPYVGNNGEKGYKTGWRLNSSRVDKDAADRCCTGFIPVKHTDSIRFKNIQSPADGNQNGYIFFYKSDFSNDAGMAYEFAGLWDNVIIPSQLKSVASTGVNATSDAAYMRISTGIIDDTSIITINEEIVEGGGTTTEYAWANTGIAFVSTDYGPRVTALEKQTAQNAADIANLKNGVASATPITDWDAPIYDANIPVFQLKTEKPAMTNAAQTPADIYARYDALMAKHPHYITKTDLGLCSDGLNHVYRYDFCEPDSRHTSGYPWSETKAKAIIVSGIHYEWAGIYGLYYALEEIAENPELYALRRNTHLIVVPCMNPYATIAANYGESLGDKNSFGVRNANGVEIHRNFEVGWVLTEAGTTHYGGPAPLSEVETQYVDTIMQENADAALFLTCHNFGDKSFDFIWPSTATAYMCNMGYRLIDKLSNVWLAKYGEELVGLDEYRTDDIPAWDNRLGFAHISQTPGTETRQGTKYNIQSANVEICGRFWTHGTEAAPEPSMSAFTMSRGAEVYVNFLLTAFGVYDPKDKQQYAPTEV